MSTTTGRITGIALSSKGATRLQQLEAEVLALRMRAEKAEAALAAAQPPAVKVKPLVWQGTDPDYIQADCGLGRYTVINTFGYRGFMLQVAGSYGATYCQTIGDAKAVAQTDYEARILGELEGGEA